MPYSLLRISIDRCLATGPARGMQYRSCTNLTIGNACNPAISRLQGASVSFRSAVRGTRSGSTSVSPSSNQSYKAMWTTDSTHTVQLTPSSSTRERSLHDISANMVPAYERSYVPADYHRQAPALMPGTMSSSISQEQSPAS